MRTNNPIAKPITLKDERRQTLKYVIADCCASALAWMAFLFYPALFRDSTDLMGQLTLFLPLYCAGWGFLHYMSGFYNKAFLKSRLSEWLTTLTVTAIGGIILFFLFFLQIAYQNFNYFHGFYHSIVFLIFVQGLLTYIGRFFITQRATSRIHSRKLGFNTLFIGTGNNAKRLYQELNRKTYSLGYNICGFIYVGGKKAVPRTMTLGELDDLDFYLQDLGIRNVIIAPDGQNTEGIYRLLTKLFHHNVNILLRPELYEILIGGVHTDTIYSTPLLSVTQGNMPQWQQNTKRIFDILVSVIALILSSPLMLLTALLVKHSSPGPIFYKQLRNGYHGHPFVLYKFRSMIWDDSPESGRELAVDNDPRITPWGHTIRKYRIDELPQFWNVLKGEMSIVGPRPEQDFFARQLQKLSPHYALLYKVKPGLTSWGMVKFGYANTIQQMLKRAEFDYLYLENRSLTIDFKIIIYTIRTILTGKGI